MCVRVCPRVCMLMCECVCVCMFMCVSVCVSATVQPRVFRDTPHGKQLQCVSCPLITSLRFVILCDRLRPRNTVAA